MKEVKIYTDGSSLSAKKFTNNFSWFGGCGGVILYNGRKLEVSEPLEDGTNQQSEIYAVTLTLKKLKERCKVTVYTDSMYVIKGATDWANGWIDRGWKTSTGEDVKNSDLWKELLTEANKHDLLFQWVKGHSGDEFNELADKLAVSASTKLKEKYIENL